ncbi:MAG: DMT family protein [Elusimicrobia bacterium]|nr:DMT family protein [Elusimicrobiota bacterium]
MNKILTTICMLTFSNVFMTFAWYAHLKNLISKPVFTAVLVSWCIAFFEYLIQVPANRIGYAELNIGQLKILQEAITLTVFVPFSVFYMKQGLRWDYLWASLLILGAVFIMFRDKIFSV